MPETIGLVILAFAVGYMTRPRLSQWWRWNRPVKCQKCGKWIRYKHTVGVQHRLAGWCNVCDTCYRQLYQPFEAKK